MPLQNTTLKILKDRLSSVPPEIASLIHNGVVDTTVEKLQKVFSLTQNQASRLSDETVLTILFFEPTHTLPARITKALGVSPEIANSLSDSLHVDIFSTQKSIYDTMDSLHINTPTASASTSAVTTPNNTTTPPQPQVPPKIKTTNPVPQPPQIRTMNQDMAKHQTPAPAESVYTTTQEAILKEGRSKTDNTDTPRWGNQT